MLPMAVARPSSGELTKSSGEKAILEFFFPIDNALYSTAFGTHTKTAEPMEMPFRMMTLVVHRYYILDKGPDPTRGMGNF